MRGIDTFRGGISQHGQGTVVGRNQHKTHTIPRHIQIHQRPVIGTKLRRAVHQILGRHTQHIGGHGARRRLVDRGGPQCACPAEQKKTHEGNQNAFLCSNVRVFIM